MFGHLRCCSLKRRKRTPVLTEIRLVSLGSIQSLSSHVHLCIDLVKRSNEWPARARNGCEEKLVSCSHYFISSTHATRSLAAKWDFIAENIFIGFFWFHYKNFFPCHLRWTETSEFMTFFGPKWIYRNFSFFSVQSTNGFARFPIRFIFYSTNGRRQGGWLHYILQRQLIQCQID